MNSGGYRIFFFFGYLNLPLSYLFTTILLFPSIGIHSGNCLEVALRCFMYFWKQPDDCWAVSLCLLLSKLHLVANSVLGLFKKHLKKKHCLCLCLNDSMSLSSVLCFLKSPLATAGNIFQHFSNQLDARRKRNKMVRRENGNFF